MPKGTGDRLTETELRRIVRKAFKRIEKMIKEEPHRIIISGAEEDSSGTTIGEIKEWLFKRRQQ